MTANEPEQPRRLGDKIVRAHEQACEQGKADVARALLRALELELSGFGNAPEQREADAEIQAAFERQQRLDSPG